MKRDDTKTTTGPRTTGAPHTTRRGGGRRLLAATGVALLGLVVLVLLGPNKEDIERRFEFYGAPGELRIMPDISIDEGQDRLAQLPKSLQAPPPPARIEVLPTETTPDATEPAPRPVETEDMTEVELVEIRDNGEAAIDPQVELVLPQQRNPAFNLLNLVRPEYPLAAPEADRRVPVIRVRLDVFFRPDGTIVDIVVLANDGSPVFAEVAMTAVRQWIIDWKIDPGLGRWERLEFRFKSPYFTAADRRPE